MLTGPDANLKARIKSLRSHIKNENPLLVEVVDHFCDLDKLAYKLGILNSKESYTCLLYTSPSPRDQRGSRMPSSA